MDYDCAIVFRTALQAHSEIAVGTDRQKRELNACRGQPLADMVRPDRRALSSRFLTDEGAHFEPPRGVRSCMRSSWLAISRNVRSGFEEWIPTTSVIRRTSGGRGGDFLRSDLSAMPSLTIHLTARRKRSGVQSKPRCLRTREISSQVWSGRIRRTIGSH